MRPVFLALLLVSSALAQDVQPYPKSEALRKEFAERESDWRNGPIVYQIFVDRFAPPADLDAKKALYAPPRTLHRWDETPKKGVNLPEFGVWSHEVAFWGGDLNSVRSKLPYVESLGTDVVYLNPIFEAFTNHKYDAEDYMRIAPEYGSKGDLTGLAEDAHRHGMKLMLDGVFNHRGSRSPAFQEALKDPKDRYRDWFYIGSEYKLGYRAWQNVPNLPENNLENPAVRRYLWEGQDSVVQSYLKLGIDGWRLDTGQDIGMKYLYDLTNSAHRAKHGSEVVAELWNYPELWFPAVDGAMDMFLGREIFNYVDGSVSARRAGSDIERLVDDCGVQPLLKSWLVLDNHDTPRLANQIPDPQLRHLAQVLQFTLPGSPVIYYGTELGMQGGDDPGDRAPTRWDLVNDSNSELSWMRKLVAIRKNSRALRFGDFRRIESDQMLAFSRTTDRAQDTVLVFANPSEQQVVDVVSTRESRFPAGTRLKDLLDGKQYYVVSGMLQIDVPAKSARILRVDNPGGDYNLFKRIQ